MNTRYDGWANVLTGLGVQGIDKRLSNKFLRDPKLPVELLEDLYRGDGMAKRIIDIYPEEMTRQGWEILGDNEALLEAQFEEMYIKDKICTALKWAKLYGGAILLLGIDDGLDFDQPVNLANIRELQFLHIFDRTQISFGANDFDRNPASKGYGTPIFYTINTTEGYSIRVHESRVLRVEGENTPRKAKEEQNGWGDSLLQSCINEIRNYSSAYSTTSLIIEDFVHSTLTINNLADLISSNQGEAVLKRMEIINRCRSVANTTILDSEEKFEKKSSSVSGLPELIDKFMQALSAVTGIPVTLLMGQSPGGLNATGEHDTRNFYDRVKQDQSTRLKPILEKLIKYMFLAKDGPTKGVEPETWSISFKPLWQMDEMQTAALRKAIADADAIYIDRGVLDPTEVAVSRFGGDRYSMETVIEDRSIESNIPDIESTPEVTPSNQE